MESWLRRSARRAQKSRVEGRTHTAAGAVRRPRLRLLPEDGQDDSLQRWVLPTVLIGAIAGLSAAALFGLLRLCTELLLQGLGGYHPYRTSAEGGFRALADSGHPWAVPLVAAGGALLAMLLVVWLAPEAGGHGTDAAIAAAHQNPGGMRGRVTVVKLAASALTIGSGGSGGTEGPAAQIAAAAGSVIARRTGMSAAQARTALVIGLASGVGAIFQAPLGGALLGAELLYRRGMDARVLPKALIAACSGWLAFGAFHGFAPPLGDHPGGMPSGAVQFAVAAVVGVAAGLAGRLYAACFYAVHLRVEARARSVAARLAAPALAALLVGGLGLLVPGVLGTGYGLMEALTDPQILLDMPVLLVLALPFAKIVGTALTVGSGGSGGIFGPCMVVGAGVGAAVWRLAEPLGLAPGAPLAFVVIGMAACLGPVAHAPLGVLLMATEMVGNASLLGPGLLAVLCGMAVTGRTTLYRSQVDRLEEPAPRRGLPAPAPPPDPAASATTAATATPRTEPVVLRENTVPGPGPLPASAPPDPTITSAPRRPDSSTPGPLAEPNATDGWAAAPSPEAPVD